MSPVILIGGLVAWSGYTVIWVGGMMLRGYSGPGRPQGPGVLDLILPSRAAKVAAILTAGAPGAASGVAPGSTQNPNGTVTGPGAASPSSPTGVGAVITPALGNGPSPTPQPSTNGPGGIGSIFGPALR